MAGGVKYVNAKKKKPRKQRPKKTAEQSPDKMPELVPQAHGGALLSGGVPGNAGGGRPPNWLKDWCDELLARPESKQQVEEILGDKNHGAYAAMWKAVADRAHGKPTQSVALEAGDGLSALIEQAFRR